MSSLENGLGETEARYDNVLALRAYLHRLPSLGAIEPRVAFMQAGASIVSKIFECLLALDLTETYFLLTREYSFQLPKRNYSQVH